MRNKYVSPLTGCAMKKCQGAAKSFSTLLDSNPCLLTHCNLPQPLSHWFILICQKKTVLNHHILQPWNGFLNAGFSFSDCSSQILRSDKIQQNSWPQQLYQYTLFDLDWSWNVFSSHNSFQCSSTRSSTSECEKNWKFRTDLQGPVESFYWHPLQYRVT